MIDLDKLERLEKAAFPSPWSRHSLWPVVYCETNRYQVGDFDDDPSASFVVALRNAAPALFAELRRLRAIEAAARSYMACANAGQWEEFVFSLSALEAALAAKGEK